MTMTVPRVVDAFVERINSEPREAQPLREVPESLREASSERNVVPDNWTGWRIVRSDNRDRISHLSIRTPAPGRCLWTHKKVAGFGYLPYENRVNDGEIRGSTLLL